MLAQQMRPFLCTKADSLLCYKTLGPTQKGVKHKNNIENLGVDVVVNENILKHVA